MATELIEITDAEQRELSNLALDITQALKTFRYAMVDMGKACSRAHEILSGKRNGAFAEWVESNTEVSLNWAYASMRVYQKFGECKPGFNIDSKAMLLLASPSVPAEVREQAIELSHQEPVDAKKAAKLIEAAQPPRRIADTAAVDRVGEEEAQEAESDVVLDPVVPRDVISQVMVDAEYALEPLKDFQVAAMRSRRPESESGAERAAVEGIRGRLVDYLEKRGIKA
jgi:hypothetical protein